MTFSSLCRTLVLTGALCLGASTVSSAQTPTTWEKDDRTWSNEGVSITLDEAFRAHRDAKKGALLDVSTPDHHFESAFLLVGNEAAARRLLSEVHQEALAGGSRPWPLKWLPANPKWKFAGEKFSVIDRRHRRFDRGVGFLSNGERTVMFLFELHAVRPADRIETTLYAVLDGLRLPAAP